MYFLNNSSLKEIRGFVDSVEKSLTTGLKGFHKNLLEKKLNGKNVISYSFLLNCLDDCSVNLLRSFGNYRPDLTSIAVWCSIYVWCSIVIWCLLG